MRQLGCFFLHRFNVTHRTPVSCFFVDDAIVTADAIVFFFHQVPQSVHVMFMLLSLSLSFLFNISLSLSLSVSASVCLRRDTTSFSFEFSWTITELLFGLGIVLNLVVSFMAVMKAVLWKHIHVDDTGRILWPRLSWRHQSDEKEKDIVDVKQQRNRKEKTQTAQCKAFHFFLIRWNG